MALEDKRRKHELDHEMRLMVMMTQMISHACLPYSAPDVPPPKWDRVDTFLTYLVLPCLLIHQCQTTKTSFKSCTEAMTVR